MMCGGGCCSTAMTRRSTGIWCRKIGWTPMTKMSMRRLRLRRWRPSANYNGAVREEVDLEGDTWVYTMPENLLLRIDLRNGDRYVTDNIRSPLTRESTKSLFHSRNRNRFVVSGPPKQATKSILDREPWVETLYDGDRWQDYHRVVPVRRGPVLRMGQERVTRIEHPNGHVNRRRANAARGSAHRDAARWHRAAHEGDAAKKGL